MAIEIKGNPIIKRELLDVDVVNHPRHYTQGAIEAIDVMEDWTKNLYGIEAICIGNAIKYLCRWKHKNGAEDLKKAIWYIQKVIEKYPE